jgi:hypothetical protein
VLKSALEFLGSPDESDLSFISNDQAKFTILKLKKQLSVDNSKRFPNIFTEGLNLMSQMIAYNPFLRLEVE